MLQPSTPAPIPLTVERSKTLVVSQPSRQLPTKSVAVTPTPAAVKPPSVSGLPVRAASKVTQKPAVLVKAVPEPKRAIPLRKTTSKEALTSTTPAIQKPVTRSESGSSISSAGSDRETRSRSTSKTKTVTKTPAVRSRARSNAEDDPSPTTRGVKGKENSHDANGSAVTRTTATRGGSAIKETVTTSGGRVLRTRKA